MPWVQCKTTLNKTQEIPINQTRNKTKEQKKKKTLIKLMMIAKANENEQKGKKEILKIIKWYYIINRVHSIYIRNIHIFIIYQCML